MWSASDEALAPSWLRGGKNTSAQEASEGAGAQNRKGWSLNGCFASDEALAPSWTRGGTNTSSVKRVLECIEPQCKSPGLGIPGNQHGSHRKGLELPSKSPELGISGNHL
eukprot:4025022-Karenia_brevis.AAC.1